MQAVCCPTKLMMADHMSEPLTGSLFKFVRAWILNLPEHEIHKKIVIFEQEKKVKTERFDGQHRSVLNEETNGKMTDRESDDSGNILKRVRKAAHAETVHAETVQAMMSLGKIEAAQEN